MNRKEKCFFEWLLKRNDVYKIEIFDVKVHDRIAQSKGFESFKIFSTKLSYKTGNFWGTGAGWDVKQVVLSTNIECIERLFARIFASSESSNGSACHFNLKDAKLNAYRELLERDAFFSHFLSTAPFSAEILPKGHVLTLVKGLKKNNLHPKFYRLACADSSLKVVVCVLTSITGKRRQFVTVGAACLEKVPDAQVKSLVEALQIANGILRKTTKPMDDKTLLAHTKMDNFRPEDHARLCVTAKIFDAFSQKLLKTKKHRVLSQSSFKFKPSIKYEIFEMSESEFYESGLIYVKAVCPDLQKPFWGFPSPSKINFNRLALIDGDLKISDLPWKTLHLFA